MSLLNPSQGQYYGSITQLDDGGTQSYNALLFSVERRLSKNLTINGNYTWSHCIADLVNSELAGNSPSYIHPDNRRGDRGNCSSDKRNLLNISAVYQTPKFGSRWTERLAGEWRLASIVRAQSGNFLSVQTGLDNSLTALVSPNGGASAQRPNQVLPNVYGDRSYNFYLNPAAFAQPATAPSATSASPISKRPEACRWMPACHASSAFSKSRRSNFAPTRSISPITHGWARPPRI